MEDFGREGEALELELFLHTGRLHEVRTWPQKDVAMDYLGALPFLAIQVQLDAASGNYDEADADLAEMIDVVRAFGQPGEGRYPDAGDADHGGHAGPARIAAAGRQPGVHGPHQPVFPRDPRENAADGRRPRGGSEPDDAPRALALESGEVKQAEQFFHDALSVWGDDARAASGAGLDFEARFLAEAGKNALKRAGYLTPKLWEQ